MSEIDLQILEQHEEALMDDLKILAKQLTHTADTIKLVRADLRKSKKLNIIMNK